MEDNTVHIKVSCTVDYIKLWVTRFIIPDAIIVHNNVLFELLKAHLNFRGKEKG